MSIVPIEHKAAGHDGSLQSADGSLFFKPTTTQEKDFYLQTQAKIHELTDEIELGSELFHWMPLFYGSMVPGVTDQLREQQADVDKDLSIDNEKQSLLQGQEFLVLENVLYGFKKPSLIDIKLGNVLYDENSSSEKIERMKKVSETTTSGSLHYRICGMKMPVSTKSLPKIQGVDLNSTVTKSSDGNYLIFDKIFGRSLTKSTVKDAFELFFFHNKLPESIQIIALENTIQRLQLLYNCLIDQETRMVGASILMIIENDTERWEELELQDILIKEPEIEDDSDSESSDAPLSALKLIDFAHSRYTPGSGSDEAILVGIENLLTVLGEIFKDKT
ncbi:hypothetical protein OGAPHI_002898 [Ogataea philodendri]|uniref:Kinase n=1 Tax=Ogataea philodendri TaxID=1378263 RepID=A0A9P8T6C8_9ASCO|nr:uncharacterized protein OGAPHI_002898 [Ogataea philodendri]KAH3667249.1 hypothetical protein OGAPHI_002898 [Ogataea philodendri]